MGLLTLYSGLLTGFVRDTNQGHWLRCLEHHGRYLQAIRTQRGTALNCVQLASSMGSSGDPKNAAGTLLNGFVSIVSKQHFSQHFVILSTSPWSYLRAYLALDP